MGRLQQQLATVAAKLFPLRIYSGRNIELRLPQTFDAAPLSADVKHDPFTIILPSTSSDLLQPVCLAVSDNMLLRFFESDQDNRDGLVSENLLPYAALEIADVTKDLVTLPLSIEPDTFPLSPVKQYEVLLGLSSQTYVITHLLLNPICSDNLFRVLLPARLFGMNYRDRIWKEIRPKPTQPQLLDSQVRAVRPLRKSYAQTVSQSGKLVPRGPDFWDLVYVVLQPPLVLQQLENLFLPHQLFPYQVPGVDFLRSRDGALLADEMGTGKTVMTIVALRILFQQGKIHKALIVSPVSVLREWDKHLEEWSPELSVTFVRGTPEIRTLDWTVEAHVYVTTYDTIRKDLEEYRLPAEKLFGFDVVVLDEAQNIKNPGSGRSRAIKRLKAKQRWALSGTPVENKIDDIGSIFEFLRPGYLMPSDMYPARVRVS